MKISPIGGWELDNGKAVLSAGIIHLYGTFRRTAGSFNAAAWKRYQVGTIDAKPKREALSSCITNMSNNPLSCVVTTDGGIHLMPSWIAIDIAQNSWIAIDGMNAPIA